MIPGIKMWNGIFFISKIDINILGIVPRNSTTNTQLLPTTKYFTVHHHAPVGSQHWPGEEEGPTHSTSTPPQSEHPSSTK